MMSSGSGHIAPLDGLRGIAILLVLMAHAGILHFGWTGIQLFFVLSGYLITKILWEEKDRHRSPLLGYRYFIIRRALRIFPLYYLYLLFWLFSFWLFRFPAHYNQTITSLLTYTFNYKQVSPSDDHYVISHLWSLSVEEQFYLFYPLLILLCSRRQIKGVALLLIATAILFRCWAGYDLQLHGHESSFPGLWLYTAVFSHLDAFMLGGCIVFFDLNKLPDICKQIVCVVSMMLLLAGGAMIYHQLFPGPFRWKEYSTHLGITPDATVLANYAWMYELLNIFFAALLLLALPTPGNQIKTGIQKCLSIAPLRFTGTISYGMYIIHLPLLHALYFLLNKTALQNRYLRFIIFLLLLEACAWLLYRYVEIYFLAMKQRFR